MNDEEKFEVSNHTEHVPLAPCDHDDCSIVKCEHEGADEYAGQADPPLEKVANEPEPPPKPSIVLTDEQQGAVDSIFLWLSCYIKAPQVTPQEFKLGGYAGTGKTTIIRTVKDRAQKEELSVWVCAFTGKAVNVLQRKGLSATTIHSRLYSFYQDPQTKQIIWTKKDRLDPEPDLIIVDESSMLSTDLYRDLLSHGHPILFVGDPGQLEPVGDNPNLMATPDIVLSKIHRQAAESPIIAMAGKLRLDANAFLPYGEHASPSGDSTVIIQRKGVMNTQGIDQIICATNKTRRMVNETLRMKMGLVPRNIVEGEKIIVLKNNRDFAVFNGMILFVDKIRKDDTGCWFIDSHDEVGNRHDALPVWKRPFQDDREVDRNEVVPRVGKEKLQMVWADFAYCITAHKSQGSEWPTVMVLDETMYKTDMRRWRYTVVTRASKKLIYCL